MHMVKPSQLLADNLQRIKTLADFNLDYSALEDDLNDLVNIARLTAQVPMAFINMMDADNLWIVSAIGFGTGCMDRNETVCQYTVLENRVLEIKDMQADERVNHLAAINQLGLKYYYGLPLRAYNGSAVGSLCIVDTVTRSLTSWQTETLALLAREVIKRLELFKKVRVNQAELELMIKQQRILAHDLRGPIGGIVGLAGLAFDDPDVSREDLLGYLSMVKQSAESVLDLANDILQTTSALEAETEQISLSGLKEKMVSLFLPRVTDKHIAFVIDLPHPVDTSRFGKGKLQQIIGNLISNAIKFTPEHGSIDVKMSLSGDTSKVLTITVHDNGVGMEPHTIDKIKQMTVKSATGTNGEVGYGLGLQLVQQLVSENKGEFGVLSTPLKGSTFTVRVPVS